MDDTLYITFLRKAHTWTKGRDGSGDETDKRLFEIYTKNKEKTKEELRAKQTSVGSSNLLNNLKLKF